ncbi:MAG: hypothetical protein ACRERD_32975 [Candidatus Binatia bacterium]
MTDTQLLAVMLFLQVVLTLVGLSMLREVHRATLDSAARDREHGELLKLSLDLARETLRAVQPRR